MHKITLRQLIILALILSLLSGASCATFAGRSMPGMDTNLYDETGNSPGSFVAAGIPLLIEHRPFAMAMRFAGLGILGFGIETELLRAEGYQSWQSRAATRLEDVQAIPLQYRSEVIRGEIETQSGMIFLPEGWKTRKNGLSWVIYAKATEIRRYEVPSRNVGAETRLGAILASLGYAVWMPDYPGMGVAPGIHPYCDPGSLARSMLHGLAAARHYLEKDMAETGRLYIAGYSEGGLAAMAGARAIMDASWVESDQSMLPRGLKPAAVYAMGAPLEMSTWFAKELAATSKPNSPINLLYLFAGQARVRPELISLERTIRADIRGSILPFLDSDRDVDELSAMIAKLRSKETKEITVGDLFEPAFLEEFGRNQSSDPVHLSIEACRMDTWTPDPAVPLILAATRADLLVPFSVAEAARAYFTLVRAAGSAPLRLLELASGSHTKAGVEALLFAVMDIDRKEAEAVAKVSPDV